MFKQKLIRVTTVPISLHKLLKGQMKFMSAYYEVVAVSSDSDLLSVVGANEGVRVKAVDMTREITPWNDFKALLKMYRFFRKENPFIVHTHTPKAGIVGMMAACLARVLFLFRLHTDFVMNLIGHMRNIPLSYFVSLLLKLMKVRNINIYQLRQQLIFLPDWDFISRPKVTKKNFQ